MADIDWDLTLDTIIDGKCVLFLGPEVFNSEKEGSLQDRLLKYLNFAAAKDAKFYEDGLFFFAERSKRTQTYLKIRRFYKQEQFHEANALFEQLVRIPFHFIVSVNPDPLLVETFQRLKLPCRNHCFDKKHQAQDKEILLTKDKPLLYNILGDVDKPESLILTHDDLFDYFDAVFQSEQGIPENLKYHITSETQNIIFLGIPFDKWYMQLLLRVLQLHKDEAFMQFAIAQSISKEVKTLFSEQFKINFISQNIAGFINELYTRCEAKGHLREPMEEDSSFIETMKKLLSLDKVDEVFQQMEPWLEDRGEQGQQLSDDLTLIANRNRRLDRKIRQDVIEHSDANLEANKIRKDLLSLLSQAQSLE